MYWVAQVVLTVVGIVLACWSLAASAGNTPVVKSECGGYLPVVVYYDGAVLMVLSLLSVYGLMYSYTFDFMRYLVWFPMVLTFIGVILSFWAWNDSSSNKCDGDTLITAGLVGGVVHGGIFVVVFVFWLYYWRSS